MPIKAKFDGKYPCIVCKGKITAGEMIEKRPDGKYCHASCIGQGVQANPESQNEKGTTKRNTTPQVPSQDFDIDKNFEAAVQWVTQVYGINEAEAKSEPYVSMVRERMAETFQIWHMKQIHRNKLEEYKLWKEG